MWLKSLGVLSAAFLFTNGIALGQDSVSAPGGGYSSAAYDLLSPAPLAWVVPSFNWADLPIRPYLHEYTGYNSNILNLYPGVALPPGVNRGDYFLRTDVGVSARPNYEAQQFFFDLDYSTTDYRHDTRFDLHNHFFDGGVNYTLNGLCTGTLVAADRTQEAPQDELVGPGVDILTTESINETGQCHIYQDISVILNANATSTRHSLPTAQLLDNNSTYGQGGLQYAWSTLDNLQALIKYSYTNYTNSDISGIPEVVRLLQYNAVYNYTLSQKLNFSVLGGLVQSIGLTNQEHSSSNGPLQPIYSISMNYRPSSKWAITLLFSRLVTAPTSIIANTQINTAETGTVSYYLTPKITLLAGFGVTTVEGAIAPHSPRTSSLLFYGNNTAWTSSLKASYSITPFTSAVASFQNSIRETSAQTNGQRVNSSIMMLGLDYRPF